MDICHEHLVGTCPRRSMNEEVRILPRSPKNEREAPGFRHGEESRCGFNRLQYFLI